MSPARTSGRAAWAGAESRNSAQPVKKITSRRDGTSGRISARNSAIGLRNSGTRKMPAAPDWFSTYDSSAARRAGLTVTRTSPASPAAYSRITHSGRFGAHTATRSPGAKRAVRARAAFSASARSPAYGQRPRSAGPGTPPTMASSSGPAAAAARRIPPTVVSATGSEVSAGQYDVCTVVIAASPSVSLPWEDHRADAAYGLSPGLGQQRVSRLPTGLAGRRHAGRDEPRDQRRREGRPAPAGHAVEVPPLAHVRWLGAQVPPFGEGVDQALTRREDVHPRPVVTE